MNRVDFIQSLFQAGGFDTYLEIGTNTGASFLPIRAARKFAVDPRFQIPWKEKARAILRHPGNLRNRYFEQESDQFFATREAFLRSQGTLDVVLVDGLHTFRAALNDVLNSLRFLREDGVIVMHDCLPPHEAAAMPTKSFPTAAEAAAASGWTGEWCGDVWKAVIYLRRACASFLDVSVLDDDYGLGIVRRRPGAPLGDLRVDEALFAEIDRITFAELRSRTHELLDLRSPAYAEEIIRQVAARGKGRGNTNAAPAGAARTKPV